MALLTDGSDDGYDYSMAVPDTISTGAKLGRAGFSRGSLATVDQLPPKLRSKPLNFDAPQLFTVPDIFPNGMVNSVTTRIAAEAAHRLFPRRARGRIHPLDLLGEWNRAYGKRGFLQYQFSMPFGAEQQLADAVRTIAESGHHSFLNVFKRMGASDPAPLSWPHPGYMLSLDFALTSGLDRFCVGLDERVLAAGGRLYLAKESRTTPEMIATMYPRLAEWQRVRDRVDPERVFASDLSRRLRLVTEPRK